MQIFGDTNKKNDNMNDVGDTGKSMGGANF